MQDSSRVGAGLGFGLCEGFGDGFGSALDFVAALAWGAAEVVDRFWRGVSIVRLI